jgi:hypothetical protein
MKGIVDATTPSVGSGEQTPAERAIVPAIGFGKRAVGRRCGVSRHNNP